MHGSPKRPRPTDSRLPEPHPSIPFQGRFSLPYFVHTKARQLNTRPRRPASPRDLGPPCPGHGRDAAARSQQAAATTPREPHLVSDLRDQRGPGVRDQARSVRRHFYRYRVSITHHHQGEPPSSGSRPFDKPRDPCSAERFRAPACRGRGRYCTLRVSVGDGPNKGKGTPAEVVVRGPLSRVATTYGKERMRTARYDVRTPTGRLPPACRCRCLLLVSHERSEICR